MKQLTCEMCGSKDLLKQDGVFVCQSCGCKYSVEEARKMMIEGTVDVQGTVRVDETAKVDNYLELSRNSYNSRNGRSAYDYANKALEIMPKNSNAWIAKMKAIEYVATLGDLKLKEVVEAGKNAIAFSDENAKSDITFEVYSYETKRALELLKLATNKMADTADIKETFNSFSRISFMTAAENTMKVDNAVTSIYDRIASEALAMILIMPNEVLAEYPEISKTVSECAKQYQSETDAFMKRLGIYGAELKETAKKIRRVEREVLEDKVKAAEKITAERKAKEQAERNEKYWEDHRDEKKALENEMARCEERIDELEVIIDELPEVAAVRMIKKRIVGLEREKKSLGLFQGKEKKVLQREIDRLERNLRAANTERDRAVEPLQEKIDRLEDRIEEIDDELTKDR